jgi:sugar transferase (PEP-CTERM/EpsH1 system associated)
MTQNLPPLVVHIIYALGTGGLENGLINLINGCPPYHYRHVIICLTRAHRLSERLTAADVEIIELHQKPGLDLLLYGRLWRQLHRLRPAIVHTRNLAALETQVLGLLMPGCKRVHGEHGRDMQDLEGRNRKYQWLRRALSPFVHRFVAVSQDLQGWLIDSVHIPAAKVTQIYDGVDIKRFVGETDVNSEQPVDIPAEFRRDGNRVILGTVGRLAAVKDQQLLLIALHRLVSARPQLRDTLRLVIVGDGPEHNALKAKIDSLCLTQLVWLSGNREDIPELLRSMDIFVLPSLAEGLPLTLLEAMATGLPVIASSVGGIPELVQDRISGILFPARDAEALTRAIASLIDHPSMRRILGQAAEIQVRERFSWQRTINSYLALYDELLAQGALSSQVKEH